MQSICYCIVQLFTKNRQNNHVVPHDFGRAFDLEVSMSQGTLMVTIILKYMTIKLYIKCNKYDNKNKHKQLQDYGRSRLYLWANWGPRDRVDR